MPYPKTYQCDDCAFHVLADAAGELALADHALAQPAHAVRLTDCVPPPPEAE